MKGDREKRLSAGANEYLTKPVGLKQLLSVINHFLEVELDRIIHDDDATEIPKPLVRAVTYDQRQPQGAL